MGSPRCCLFECGASPNRPPTRSSHNILCPITQSAYRSTNHRQLQPSHKLLNEAHPQVLLIQHALPTHPPTPLTQELPKPAHGLLPRSICYARATDQTPNRSESALQAHPQAASTQHTVPAHPPKHQTGRNLLQLAHEPPSRRFTAACCVHPPDGHDDAVLTKRPQWGLEDACQPKVSCRPAGRHIGGSSLDVGRQVGMSMGVHWM